MSGLIFPRSPRETMAGWVHLPRYIDKIRLHMTGKLHPDYHAISTMRPRYITATRSLMCSTTERSWAMKM